MVVGVVLKKGGGRGVELRVTGEPVLDLDAGYLGVEVREGPLLALGRGSVDLALVEEDVEEELHLVPVVADDPVVRLLEGRHEESLDYDIVSEPLEHPEREEEADLQRSWISNTRSRLSADTSPSAGPFELFVTYAHSTMVLYAILSKRAAAHRSCGTGLESLTRTLRAICIRISRICTSSLMVA